MILLELFWNFFQIGLFTVGGGYASLPLIQSRIVDVNGWMTLNEFTDLIAISQMTPGPIGINAATFVGTRVAGIPGALAATIGNVTPAVIMISILAYIYNKYGQLRFIKGVLGALRPVVVALIASAAVTILLLAVTDANQVFNWTSAILLAVVALGVFIMQKYKWNSLVMMLVTGAAAALLYAFGITF